ncbi:hypothetical protein [Agarivorans sp. Alg241-V36]|uniref:hypothetical protein n=1 Tax=Agarivorans sp. Alg241-V36 TaxID=2305992 RepID=UPI0013D59298|nr:hypothetical protein [Agarivorans sp. Alg241-V36]
MNQHELLDNNRSRFSWLVTFCIVLLVVLLLLISFIRTIAQAERQVVEEYTQTWVRQLAQVHGLWIARFRPEQLEVNLYQRDALTGEQKPLEVIRLAMSQAGWPKVASAQQCQGLWRDMVGAELSGQGNAVIAAYKNQQCHYEFADVAILIYDPQQGLMTKEWL